MIDTLSDPGAWQDAILFPPFIDDERDGVLVNHAFRIRHDAGADLTEPFHARPHNEGSQHNHG